MSEKNESKSYSKALQKVFIIHVFMFVVTFTAAIIANSSSVLADSLDFIGDAINYALAIFVLSRGIIFKALVSITKAVTMLSFGIPVMVYALTRYTAGSVPDYEVMSWAGMLGIFAHGICIYYLFQYRTGDSNRLSVWICTINDLVSNILTVIASQLVKLTDSIYPDIIAAALIVAIAIYGAIIILRQAIKELKSNRPIESYE